MASSPHRPVRRAAALESWARTPDRTARTEPARQAALDRFEREVRERFPDMADDEIAIRAEQAKRAFYLRIGVASAKARRAKAARKRGQGA